MAQNTWLHFTDLAAAKQRVSGYTFAALDVVEDNLPVREDVEFVATGEVTDVLGDVYDGVIVLTNKAIYIGHGDSKTGKSYASWVDRSDPTALDRLRDRGKKAVFRTNGVSGQSIAISVDSALQLEQRLAAPPEPEEVRAARKERERAEQEEAQRLAEAAEAQRQRELEAERERVRKLEEQRTAERKEEIAAMPPLRRWIFSHIPIVVGVAAVLVIGLIIGGFSMLRGIQEEQKRQDIAAAEAKAIEDRAAADLRAEEERAATQARQEEQRVAAEAEAAAQYQALVAGCDPDSFEGVIEEELLIAWASCENDNTRAWVAGQRKTPKEVLERLSGDNAIEVKAAVAGNRQSPGKVLRTLGSDPNVQVRAALASNRAAPEAEIKKLLKDPELQVRRALIPSGAQPILRELAQSDPSPRVRNAALKELFGGQICGKNVTLANYIGGTEWEGKLTRDASKPRIYKFSRNCGVSEISSFGGPAGYEWARWKQNGNRVSWNAWNPYRGTISGNTMSGSSRNGPFTLRKGP